MHLVNTQSRLWQRRDGMPEQLGIEEVARATGVKDGGGVLDVRLRFIE